MKKLTRRFNWRPDLPDCRDFPFKKVAPRKLPRLPKSIDLRAQCSAVVNQGQIGSCTGNALAGALEYLELQQLATKTRADDTQVFVIDGFLPVSRLFVYYNERAIEGRVDQDAGASLRDGVKSLVTWGACREPLWKYAPANVFKKPSPGAYKDAKPHCVSSYYRLESLDEMKQCLALGFPFAFGFSVYESFESPTVAKTGRGELPRAGERMLGGHAVLAVGYSDAEKRFLIRNSWGPEWGMGGYFTLPYDYVTNPNLAQDFWTVRK